MSVKREIRQDADMMSDKELKDGYIKYRYRYETMLFIGLIVVFGIGLIIGSVGQMYMDWQKMDYQSIHLKKLMNELCHEKYNEAYTDAIYTNEYITVFCQTQLFSIYKGE